MGLRCILKIRSLYDGIDRASLLTSATIDALGHIDVISRGATRAVRTWFRLYRDGLCRANGLAELTSDATLLSRGISPQSMLATKARRQRTFFHGVVERHFGLEKVLQSETQAAEYLCEKECLRRLAHHCLQQSWWNGGEYCSCDRDGSVDQRAW